MAKILLAEDEPHIGDMVAFKLTNSGHEVIRAGSGDVALDLAGSDRPDLIVLDVMMPVLDGFEVLAALKRDTSLQAIPVIMLTAKGQERDVLNGFAKGAVDYIVKPFSLKELMVRIDSALR